MGECPGRHTHGAERATEKRPVAGEHYIARRDDYADLIEKIEWCRTHREICRRIGRQAKKLFEASSVPHAIWAYVSRRLSSSV